MPQISMAKDFYTKAKQAILVDYDTGVILYEKNAYDRMHPSSMSKIMTAYLAFSYLKEGSIKLNDKFRTSKKAWQMQGSKMFLSFDDEVTVDQLLRGIIVQSGNDASVAIAEGIFGDENIFVDRMNDKALELGLNDSHFANATGLTDNNHYMTARDLALLAIHLLKDFPEYYFYHQEKSYQHNKILQNNRNDLLGINGTDGIKTGYTDAGGYGIVISASKNNRRLIGVVNGLQNTRERTEEAKRLLSYGFDNYSVKTIYKTHEEIEKIKVLYGKKPSLSIGLAYDIKLPVDKNLTSLDNIELEYDGVLMAPVKKETVVGKIKLPIKTIDSDQIIMPLITVEDVSKGNFIQRIIENIKYFLT